MAQRVITNVQGEILGRNQAIKHLKKTLAVHGIRIDLALVFENRQSYELLAIYFDQTEAEDGSQKFVCTPKPGFLNLVQNKKILANFRLLPAKAPKIVTNETFGRNQAIQCLKKALAVHDIRIDLALVFENRQSYELLAIYFDQTEAEDGSQKFVCTPKPGFLNLVQNKDLLSHYRLLLAKPPAVVDISVNEISGEEAAALLADACSPA